jgi:zinc transport system ATP-binding protein
MSILSVRDLSFAYSSEVVLEDINFDVEDRDFLAIIGPNGGGKSTLLKLMLGILAPKQGNIEIFGKQPSSSLSLIGYVPQNTNVNTDFPIKVIEVVLMGHVGGKRPMFGYGDDEVMCAMGALSQVGMDEFAEKKIGDLSGGQRQRVMIARALCAHPKILLLDEPTSSIDVKGQRDIYDLLKTLNSDITIIVVSHDISVILEYASKVVHINKRVSFHDISDRSKTFHMHHKDEHFCEVELLQMLGAGGTCEECASSTSATSTSSVTEESRFTVPEPTESRGVKP